MWSFRMPKILLLIRREDGPVVGDEIGDVEELGIVEFHDCAGDDADV
jgi:hypothetical protein